MSAPPLHLDFVAPPVYGWRRWCWAALALMVVCVVVLAQLQSVVSERLEAAQARQDLLRERLRASGPRAMPPADAQTTADIQRANLVIDELVVPWERLFDAIEEADAIGLGALALTPNARDRTLRLAGEARDLNELLAYVDRMGAQPLLGEVHLQSYNTVARDGQSVLSFNLAAVWRPVP